MNPDCWGKTTSKVDALFKRGNSGYLEHDLGDFVAVRVAEHSSQLQKQVIDVLARGECGDESHAPDPLLDWCYYVRTKGVYGPLAEAPTQHRQDWFRWMAEVGGSLENGLTCESLKQRAKDPILEPSQQCICAQTTVLYALRLLEARNVRADREEVGKGCLCRGNGASPYRALWSHVWRGNGAQLTKSVRSKRSFDSKDSPKNSQ